MELDNSVSQSLTSGGGGLFIYLLSKYHYRNIILFNVYECFAYMYACASLCVPGVHASQRRVLELLKLELGMV